MSNLIHIKGFEIDTSKIPDGVIEDKCKNLSLQQKKRWGNEYGSEYNFLALLFHLKFIEKLENQAIYRVLGYKNAASVQHLLYGLGWAYSFDYDKNCQKFQSELKRIQILLEEAKKKSPYLDISDPQYIKLKQALKKAEKLKKNVYQRLNFSSSEEYARTFYYLTYIQNISPKELIHVFNLKTVDRVQYHIREKLGINKNTKEGMRGKVERGSHDYGRGKRAGQITRRKEQLKNYSPSSSSNEEYLRRQISDQIYKYFDAAKYEIVVGVNNTGIIAPLEIDIPIVIYVPKQNSIFRFAIEYNGEHVHEVEKDIKKQKRLEKKGWIYIEVHDIPGYSNSRRLFDRKILEICELIKKNIERN